MEFNRQEGTVPDVKVEKKRCSECGRMKPLTTLIPAQVGGDYRRSPRSGHKRVCSDCTQEHVDYARRGQEENRNTPIDTYRMTWSVAVREFQIDAEGLS
jgi:hypothetical protein